MQSVVVLTKKNLYQEITINACLSDISLIELSRDHFLD